MNINASNSSTSIWPKCIVSIFLLLPLGGGLVVYLALKSAVPMLDERPYEAAENYELTIEGKRNVELDRLSAVVELNGSLLNVDIQGLPDTQATKFNIRLVNTQDAAKDRNVTANSDRPRLETSINLDKGSAWIVQMWVTSLDKTYYFESKQIIPASEEN